MKTLGLLLLLFTLCCCYAAMAPASAFATCCTDVATVKVPPGFIRSITKTHSVCSSKAFIVETIRGRRICYSQTFEWAEKLYSQLHR